jgi:hypothetical protein
MYIHTCTPEMSGWHVSVRIIHTGKQCCRPIRTKRVGRAIVSFGQPMPGSLACGLPPTLWQAFPLQVRMCHYCCFQQLEEPQRKFVILKPLLDPGGGFATETAAGVGARVGAHGGAVAC